ncbi:hypothetical protein K523DRAFT_257925, partial [Schizophyllum commune Tattone D]
PAESPDISPIEPVWDILKRRLYALLQLPTSVEELRKKILEVWDGITVDEINHFIHQMPERVEAVIKTLGGPTKY